MKVLLKRSRAIVYRLVGAKRYRHLKFLPRWDRQDLAAWRKGRGERDDLEYFFLLLFIAVLGFFSFSLLCLIVTMLLPGDGVWFPFKETLFPDEKPEGWDQLRSFAFAIAGIVGAVFGLFQLYNSAARTRLNRIDIQTKREQERNERFVRASELLKDEDASVRMAGIYALERLALEPDGGYCDAVLKVLAGFVRERTTRGQEWGDKQYPAAPLTEKPVFEIHNDVDEAIERYRIELYDWLQLQKRPTEPVQTAVNSVTIIIKKQEELKVIDFSGAILTRASFGEASFERSVLPWCRIEGAFLKFAHFEEAMLPWAHLEGADFSDANLQRASLAFAHLQGANFVNANLEGADLRGCNLAAADIESARLEGAILKDADLSAVMGLTEKQLSAAVWPSAAPPMLPDGIEVSDFDKSAYTDPDDLGELLPRYQWTERKIM